MPNPFLAIADPTRRAILRLLGRGELPAGRIAAAFPQQRPAISKHLTILKRAGLINEARNRQQRLYAVRPDALAEVRLFLAEVSAAEPAVLHEAIAPRELLAADGLRTDEGRQPSQRVSPQQSHRLLAGSTRDRSTRDGVPDELETPEAEPQFPVPAYATFDMEID